MAKSKIEYEKIECPNCEVYLEEIKKLKDDCKKMSDVLQKVQTDATKMELTLKKNGLLEQVSEITDEEAICVEQITRLKEVSALRSFTETESKILDILHKNLRMARGQTVENAGKKNKNYSKEELLVLVQNEK